MLESSRDLITSGDAISGPDFFGLYKSEIDQLLSQDDSLLPFPHQVSKSSASIFSNGIGALLTESKKERLNSLLRQGVFALTQEINEWPRSTHPLSSRLSEESIRNRNWFMKVDPVLSVRRIRSCLRSKDKLLSLNALTCKGDQPQHPNKKAKVIPACSDKVSEHVQLDEDLRIILEYDSTTEVEELMESHTNEISATLYHMEKTLDELLNVVMTSCRDMTLAEKQQLRRMIQKLPARNLDRVIEIIGSNNPPKNEVTVDLDGLENVTLWRLYFYVATVVDAMAK